ncbi:phosphoesterase, partial [Chytridium lagenaria]
KGQLLTNMDGVWHPSQPNYIAMIAGSKHNVLLNNDAEVNAPNIADLLEKKGKTWRAYQQNYPGNCYTGSTYDNGLYVRKHNPFMSFNSIRNNPARCANIVPATYLDLDAQARNLPNYMFYTPNMINSGHDSSIATYSVWLKAFLEPKLKDPVYADTLFIVTYDESESYLARNQVYTVLLGAGIKGKGYVDNTSYNHYSVLKAIEQNFQLGNMGKHDSESSVSTLALNWKTC